MGVYIVGMEMPKERESFTVTIKYNGLVFDTETMIQVAEAHEVPPHGRLIDADALRSSIKESIDECHKWADEVDKDTMMYARISQSIGTFVECSLRAKAAATIIPASDKDINGLCKKEGERCMTN